MDLDADGKDDIISGSYWPGELWVFWGEGDATYRKGETLKDAEGKALHAGPTWKSEKEYEQESLASAPCAWDWDGDGDFDMLIGNIGGSVILVPNEGTAKKPAFNRAHRKPVQAAGEPLKVSGDAGPCVADWDGDGLADLIVGSGDGTVTFFRNGGAKGEPKFDKGVLLIPGTKNSYQDPAPHGAEPSGPGIRTKVCVTDWNRDGRADLLVGDYWYERGVDRKLSPEQEKRREELLKRSAELNAAMAQAQKALKGDGKEIPADYMKFAMDFAKVREELGKLESPPISHGSVWLYLREAPPKVETK